MPNKPYGGTSEDRLVDLINADNNTSYELNVDFTLGEPIPSNSQGGRNTRIKLTPSEDHPDVGAQDLTYTRLSIGVLGTLPEELIEDVDVSVPFTIHQVLSEINEKLGLDLTESEVLNTSFTTESSRYRLTITNSSKAWLPGSFYDFKSTYIEPVETPLSDVISVTALDGLEW